MHTQALATWFLWICTEIRGFQIVIANYLVSQFYLNFQAVTRVKPYICTMPLRLDEGWNQIQLNLADYTRRAYGTNYVETLRVQVHANCRLRRIYFSDRLYSEEELPPEFKLYLPMQVRITCHFVVFKIQAHLLVIGNFCTDDYSFLVFAESMKTSFGTSEAIISNLSVLHGFKMCCHSAV